MVNARRPTITLRARRETPLWVGVWVFSMLHSSSRVCGEPIVFRFLFDWPEMDVRSDGTIDFAAPQLYPTDACGTESRSRAVQDLFDPRAGRRLIKRNPMAAQDTTMVLWLVTQKKF
jgi:hypothetical protein